MNEALANLVLFKNPSASPLFVARLASCVGVGFGQLALSWGVMGLGYGAGGLSIVLTCHYIPAILLIFGGVAGDRFRRHHVLVTAELLASVAWLSLGFCFLRQDAPLPLVCALAALAGTALALFLPTIRGIVADLLTGEERARGNALISQIQSIGLLVGLGCSGMVVSAFGPGWAALIRGILCATSAILLGRLAPAKWSAREHGLLGQLRGGWHAFTAHPWVWLMTLQYTAVTVATICYSDLVGPLYMSEGHGGASAWGFINAAEALGALAGAAIGTCWKPVRPTRMAVFLPAAAAIPMLLMASGVSWAILIAAALVPGVCLAVYFVLWTTALQNVFPPEVLVRVNSWNLVASYVLMPITIFGAGPLIEATDPQATAFTAGLLVLTATGLSLIALPRSRHPHTTKDSPDLNPQQASVHASHP